MRYADSSHGEGTKNRKVKDMRLVQKVIDAYKAGKKDQDGYVELDEARRVVGRIAESMSRYCGIYKAVNGKYYLELAPDEYGEADTAITYGPFSSADAADDYLSRNFSNPGSVWTDHKGNAPVPTKSPNGSRVQSPSSRRW